MGVIRIKQILCNSTSRLDIARKALSIEGAERLDVIEGVGSEAIEEGDGEYRNVLNDGRFDEVEVFFLSSEHLERR